MRGAIPGFAGGCLSNPYQFFTKSLPIAHESVGGPVGVYNCGGFQLRPNSDLGGLVGGPLCGHENLLFHIRNVVTRRSVETCEFFSDFYVCFGCPLLTMRSMCRMENKM